MPRGPAQQNGAVGAGSLAQVEGPKSPLGHRRERRRTGRTIPNIGAHVRIYRSPRKHAVADVDIAQAPRSTFLRVARDKRMSKGRPVTDEEIDSLAMEG